jgi:hypothetical protein
MMSMPKAVWVLLFSLTAPLLKAQLPAKTMASPGDSVQIFLYYLSLERPGMVGFIPETQRYYLLDPRREAVPEDVTIRLQDAFYYDFSGLCMAYGKFYLADWATIMSKAARESFWGASYLCNRANNYFGLRRNGKEWMCQVFGFCDTVIRNDPEPTPFVVFPSFATSLWMFMHTIYSRHYLMRLPDMGARVADAITFERRNGRHYWEADANDTYFVQQLIGPIYTPEELIYTWSEHPINNLCINCNRQTDREWVDKVWVANQRAR